MERIIVGTELSQLVYRENNRKRKIAQDQSPLWQIQFNLN